MKMKALLALLFVMLIGLSGTTALSPVEPPPLNEGAALCDVTVEGYHGGATEEITFDASESQVRTRVGWWAELARGGDEAYHRLSPGEEFEVGFNLRLACNAHRRYRFVFSAGGQTHTYTFPSEDGFTQELHIDLGDVSRFFDWIEPGEGPISEQPVTIDQTLLEGEWVRKESNHDPNDGMRIMVSGNSATLTFVPESASSAWEVGEVLWDDISSDGSLEVLGSNNRYYPAQMTPNGALLEVDIHHNGAGNDQTWTRAESCWPDDYMASYPNRAPDMWVRYSTALPQAFGSALQAARDAHAPIQTAAFTPDNEWVIVAANKPCYSAGFPSGVREWIDNYIDSGREIDVVAFGPGGRWLVIAEDYVRRTTNVSEDILEKIRLVQGQGRRVTSFAFSDEPDTGWVMTAGGGLYGLSSTDFDQNIREAMSAANSGRQDMHEVAIAPDGAWAFVAEDMFATRDAPASFIEWLENYRTESNRRIDHVVLQPIGGDLRWAIISNSREPRPDATDLPDVVEHGLPGDSTIYQRMKLHGITALSMAVVQNNEVAWARAYGLREFDMPESYVYPKTVFDAASISKPVSYAAALQMVDDGLVSLTDTGVLFPLAGDELPARAALNSIRADQISMAHLLSHCAGIDNQKGTSGAQAIAPGDPLPTISQVFQGINPASTGNQIVSVDSIAVGTMVDYSGANSILIQALADHYADGGYDGLMRDFLDALSMRRSRVDTDFWQTMAREWFARGHWTDSLRTRTTKGDVQVFPNQAAAGLRSTATDLAQFVIMLNQGGLYDGQRILNQATVDQFVGRDGAGTAVGTREAVCSSSDNMQLGIRAVNRGGSNERYFHGGLHNGYRTYMSGRPQQNAGVVIMITGRQPDADALRDEIRTAIQNAYGWWL